MLAGVVLYRAGLDRLELESREALEQFSRKSRDLTVGLKPNLESNSYLDQATRDLQPVRDSLQGVEVQQ
jgi:hypothetical protein